MSGYLDRDDATQPTTAMTNRRSVLATLGAAALAGCVGRAGEPAATDEADGTSSPTATPTRTPEPVDITYRGRFKRVGLQAAVNTAGVELGTWADQGLDVTYATASGSQAAAKSVASGKDTFGNGGIAAVLQLIESGAPLVILAQITAPMGGIVSLAEAGIDDWTDLEGAVVGKFPFGSTGPAAKTAMRKRGVDLSAVTFQNIQPGSGKKLLLDGSLDATVKYFPQMQARLEHAGETPSVLKTSDVLDHLGVTLYARRETVEQQPDLVDGFVRGWLNAFQVWATRVDAVIEEHAPLVVGGFDEELERKTLGPIYAAQAPPKAIGLEHGKGWTPAERLDATLDIFTEAGLLAGDVAAEETYTNEFIERNETLAVETAEALYGALERCDVGPDYL